MEATVGTVSASTSLLCSQLRADFHTHSAFFVKPETINPTPKKDHLKQLKIPEYRMCQTKNMTMMMKKRVMEACSNMTLIFLLGVVLLSVSSLSMECGNDGSHN